MKSPASVLLTLFALAVLAGGAYLYFEKNDMADRGRFGMDAVPVVVAAVGTLPFSDRIEAIGTATANESLTITATVSDIVRDVFFSDGQLVRKGDILLRLNAAEQSALVEEARATLLEAEQQLERTRDLVTRGNASKAVLDERVRMVEEARSRLAAAEARLADRTVRAPFNGLLGLRQVSPGALISPGTPITTLDDLSPIKLDFAIPESFLSAISPGQTVLARAAAFPGELFEGHVTTISSRVDPVTRAVTIRAEIPNEDQRLRPGMLLTVEVISNEREAIAVPEGALVPVGSEQFLYVVKPDNTVERRRVTVGARKPGYAEIIDGIALGETIVVTGTMRLRPGIAVEIVGKADPGENPQV